MLSFWPCSANSSSTYTSSSSTCATTVGIHCASLIAYAEISRSTCTTCDHLRALSSALQKSDMTQPSYSCIHFFPTCRLVIFSPASTCYDASFGVPAGWSARYLWLEVESWHLAPLGLHSLPLTNSIQHLSQFTVLFAPQMQEDGCSHASSSYFYLLWLCSSRGSATFLVQLLNFKTVAVFMNGQRIKPGWQPSGDGPKNSQSGQVA